MQFVSALLFLTVEFSKGADTFSYTQEGGSSRSASHFSKKWYNTYHDAYSDYYDTNTYIDTSHEGEHQRIFAKSPHIIEENDEYINEQKLSNKNVNINHSILKANPALDRLHHHHHHHNDIDKQHNDSPKRHQQHHHKSKKHHRHQTHTSFHQNTSPAIPSEAQKSPSFALWQNTSMNTSTELISSKPQVMQNKYMGQDSRQRRREENEMEQILPLQAVPKFDTAVDANVLAQLGSHAYLQCRILHLGDKSVSWVRNQDSHILTVDRYTFISDDRFMARFEAATQTWTLQIKFVTQQDAGSYECQVSTEPKMSRAIQLRIIRPVVTIPGGSELHVRSGSDVTIKCVISQAIEPPPYVFWYHEGAQMRVEGGSVQRVSSDTALAALHIRGVTRARAGNYTCAPAGLSTASVTLHVLNGEHPAAMQHGTSTATPSSAMPLIPLSSTMSVMSLLSLALASRGICNIGTLCCR